MHAPVRPPAEAPVVLDGTSLRIADVVRVARGGVPARLAPAAEARLREVRAIVDGIVARHEVVYGITTGFGKLSDVAIPPGRLAELQVNLVRSHAAGVGPLLSAPEVRAITLLRANVLARGHSGIRAEVVQRLLALLALGMHAPIPEQGSVGASGDLAPLSHLALALIGEGMLLDGAGVARPAADVWAEHGFAPLVLRPKEGLALVNGTQAHTALAALALHDARVLWQAAHVTGAASLDALLGTPVAFDARIHAVRGQPGQERSAAVLRRLLEGSALRESHRLGDPRVQDAYALRCMPQVHGPVLEALDFAEGLVARELNAATDNPLVFEDGTMLSGGNFHGQAVAMACDVLAIALTNLATMAERRIDRLVHPDLNQGLPPFLTPDPGVCSGFMMAQVTAAALASECKGLAHPASVDTIPTDGGKEDVVPMAMGAATKLRRVVHNTAHVIAIELMCAVQGIECRRPLRSSPRIEEAVRRVRAIVPRLEADRVLTHDMETLAAAVLRGELVV